MSSLNHSASGVSSHSIPLFASSWVALFLVLRQGFEGRPESTKDLADDSLTESTQTRN